MTRVAQPAQGRWASHSTLGRTNSPWPQGRDGCEAVRGSGEQWGEGVEGKLKDIAALGVPSGLEGGQGETWRGGGGGHH